MEKKKNKQGRPKLTLDEEKVEFMAASCMPVESIAIVLGCHKDSLYERYSDALQRGRENRKMQLSAAMWEKALVEKDCKMQIWLSKQHLGHKDTFPDEIPNTIMNISINEVPK